MYLENLFAWYLDFYLVFEKYQTSIASVEMSKNHQWLFERRSVAGAVLHTAPEFMKCRAQLSQYCSFTRWNVSICPSLTEIA